MLPIAVLALARPTFDVPFAEEIAGRAFAAIDQSGIKTIGPRALLFDAQATREALADIDPGGISAVLILQVTFADATMALEIARALPRTQLGIWAFPEPRLGGRLRLNAFCGLNLAAHALGRAGLGHGWLYGAPEIARLGDFLDALTVPRPAAAPRARTATVRNETAKAGAERLDRSLAGRQIGLIGEHPAGFDTCRYDPAAMTALAGVNVVPVTLGETFDRARRVSPDETARRHQQATKDYAGLDGVDRGQLDKSLALHAALEGMAAEKSLDALAVRCWPETFTDYGCAVCGPMGMLTEGGRPAACEADVYGALTAMLMQEAAGAPAWLVDIVDMDAADNTAVLWHCGSAPLSMRDPEAPVEAQIHSNRKMPLLAQFPLKPGPITLARISQARNRTMLVLGFGEVRRAPMSFTGTSAVVALKGGIAPALATLIDGALEHHVAIAYGDHRPVLEAWAAGKGLPVLDLTN